MRDALIDEILTFLANDDLLDAAEVRAGLQREIDDSGPEAPAQLRASLTADDGWSYHPPDPLARRIHHHLADRFIDSASTITGTAHLDVPRNAPLVLLSNHLSYADANVVDVLLDRADCSEVSDRLTAIAGPKVFSVKQRLFSSLCFGTIRVPQSTGVATGDALMSARQVAVAARTSLASARSRIEAGDVLLLFGEGTRSRTAAMGHILPGCVRYFDAPGTLIVPMGLAGAEHLYPVGDSRVHRSRVHLRLGPAISAEELAGATGGNRQLMADHLGRAIAQQLPPAYRGVYNNSHS